MKLVSYRPFPDFFGLRNEIDRVFQDAMSGKETEAEAAQASWAPRVDIHETEAEFVITADLPGVEKEDIKIAVNDGTMTISGNKKVEREQKDTNFHRIERFSGSYMRSFGLPPIADTEKIAASYKNGVLTVKVPKKEESKPKEIPVKVE